MTYQNKPNSGALFRNKKSSDKQPDWKGDVDLNGVTYELAGWEKEGRNGTFLSLKIQPKQERKQDDYQRPQAGDTVRGAGRGAWSSADPDDDVPFSMEWR